MFCMGTFDFDFPWWFVYAFILIMGLPTILAAVDFFFWRKYKKGKTGKILLWVMIALLVFQVVLLADAFLLDLKLGIAGNYIDLFSWILDS
jgi:hypothetical protein